MTLTAPVAAPAAPRRQRITPPLVLGGGIMLVSLALHVHDPHQSGSWGYCPWFLLTGTYCPGCGGLRAVNDLTNGDVAGAASSNLAFMVSIPFFVLLWGRSFVQRWQGVRSPLPRGLVATASVVALVLLVVFTVARNLPSGSWLAP
jgi:hypothetical protein